MTALGIKSMNVLIPLLIGLGLLLLASRTYPFYLSRKLGVDDSIPTPAHRFRDDYDYVPTKTHVVFGHHFATIAGRRADRRPDAGPRLRLGRAVAVDRGRLHLLRRGARHGVDVRFGAGGRPVDRGYGAPQPRRRRLPAVPGLPDHDPHADQRDLPQPLLQCADGLVPGRDAQAGGGEPHPAHVR